jgi:hypothetical protein
VSSSETTPVQFIEELVNRKAEEAREQQAAAKKK